MAVILMAVGDDRPGLTRSLADAILDAGGNWLESHFARLGDKFVGSVLVDLPDDRIADLEREAKRMDAAGFHVSILPSTDRTADPGKPLIFELVGKDRPGIIREVTAALATHDVNIEELESATADGAMFGDRLFRARARVIVPEDVPMDRIREALEGISGEIMVDFEN